MLGGKFDFKYSSICIDLDRKSDNMNKIKNTNIVIIIRRVFCIILNVQYRPDAEELYNYCYGVFSCL